MEKGPRILSPQRAPAHPSITELQISTLVETFYARIETDPRLGPIFERRVNGDWSAHLAVMKSFWCSVLLKTGEYKGKPVPKHQRMRDVWEQDFAIWLSLFEETASEIFQPEAVPIVVATAERIAQSLWLSMFGSLGAAVPEWLKKHQRRLEGITC